MKILEQIREKLNAGEYQITRQGENTMKDSLCAQCGEIWIPGSAAERMNQAIRGKLKPKRRIPVPVY